MTSNYIDRIKNLARRLSEEVSIDIAQDLMQEFKRAGFLDSAYYVYLDILNYLNAHLSNKIKYDIEFIKQGDKGFKNLSMVAKTEDPLLSVKFVDYSSVSSSNYEYSLLMCKSTEKDVQFSGLMKLWVSNGLTRSDYRYRTSIEDSIFRIRNNQDLEEGLGFFCNTSLSLKDIPKTKMIQFVPYQIVLNESVVRENNLISRRQSPPKMEGEQHIVVIPSIAEYTANRMPQISQMIRRRENYIPEPEHTTHRFPINPQRYQQNPDPWETFGIDEDQTVESRNLNEEYVNQILGEVEQGTVGNINLNEEYANRILGEVEEGTFEASRIRPPSSETLNPSSTTDEPSSENKGNE